MPSESNPPARVFVDGRFELLDVLGEGGMGVVYRALDRERGVQVALKTLRGVTPEGVLRFKAEFRALRDIRHPNLVQLGELFESDGTWLSEFPWAPPESALTRSVVPSWRSRTKMSMAAFVSPETRSEASLLNTTKRPSAEIEGS